MMIELANTVLWILVWLLAGAASFYCGYLLVLTLLSRDNRLPQSPAAFAARLLRFDVVVPAHNERTLIESTVRSLLGVDWPQECFRVIVVADNCTDETAILARAAGALVLERRNERLRGKGYALELGCQFSQSCNWADAVVVVDADSEVSTNLLTACATRIIAGAHAVQVHYGVRDPNTSWRTRLMCIALSAFHRVRSRARERLRLSAGLRGNGWCVTHTLLKRVPYRAFSLAEDVEYGIEAGLAGYRVHYADEAHVNGEMVSDAKSARSQRQRWEHGRFALTRAKTVALLDSGLRQPSRVCLDLALDLIVPPLSYVALTVTGLLVGATLLRWWEPSSWLASGLQNLGWFCAACLAFYVLRGWQLTGLGSRGLLDLARAPFFVAWKVFAMARSREPLEWIRTRRRSP